MEFFDNKGLSRPAKGADVDAFGNAVGNNGQTVRLSEGVRAAG
jgi:hypothetical protein